MYEYTVHIFEMCPSAELQNGVNLCVDVGKRLIRLGDGQPHRHIPRLCVPLCLIAGDRECIVSAYEYIRVYVGVPETH